MLEHWVPIYTLVTTHSGEYRSGGLTILMIQATPAHYIAQYRNGGRYHSLEVGHHPFDGTQKSLFQRPIYFPVRAVLSDKYNVIYVLTDAIAKCTSKR